MKQKFDVSGMTCAACQSTIEKDLSKLSGVNEVTVSLLTNSMIVDFDEVKSDPSKIIKTVKRSGYKASLIHSLKKERQDIAQEEIKEMKTRLFGSIVFFIPLIYLSMGPMIRLPVSSFFIGTQNGLMLAFTELLLVLPIIFLNYKYYKIGFMRLWQRKPNMDSLIAIGSSAAFIYSVLGIYQMIKGFALNDYSLIDHALMNLYFEATGAILTLVTLGKFLEALSKGQTKTQLEKLLDLSPKTAIKIVDGIYLEISIDDIKVDDILLVKPGSKVPVDGVIVEGFTSIDESMISGEPIPVDKGPNDNVISATLNQSGSFQFKATKVGANTTINQIISLVENASTSKAPIQKLADTVSSVFVPVVIAISLISFTIWMLLGESFSFSLSIAITVLVISCPCALGLATPVAIMVGTGKAAQNGVLIKSAETLQKSEKVDTVILDKTGTITEGKPEVTDVLTFDDISKDDFIDILYSLEINSEHPLGKSIIKYALLKNAKLLKFAETRAIPGKGFIGTYENNIYLAGNESMMVSNEIDVLKYKETLNILAKEGKTAIYVGKNQEIIGIIAFRDKIKQGSILAISRMKKRGLEVVMLTGDTAQSAGSWKEELGLNTIYSEVEPAQKEQIVIDYQNKGKIVAMIGDGINDSIALVRSNVGIAIGAGSDIAIESADIVLIKNDLQDALFALSLSKKTMTNVKMNLFWAFFYNIILIPIAAGLFFYSFHLKLDPVFASLAMSLSSVTVVLNALRLKFIKNNKGENE
ncbi:MAG: heavy metal translocating P-type ATPase [Candidatus Izemoplasmatales bacterium]|nr:heavy metal translocating P-type ATPase [Candidatus Izemoplasmatales bacterium]